MTTRQAHMPREDHIRVVWRPVGTVGTSQRRNRGKMTLAPSAAAPVTAWPQGPGQERLPHHCLLTPDAQLLLPPPPPAPGPNPTQAVLPEGNARCSGKSAPKPQPAHILAVGSHQSLFTGAIFSLKESCCALGCSVLSLCRVPLICMTRSSSWGSDPEGSWEASN